MALVKCVALRRGFFGEGTQGRRIREGQEFMVPDTTPQGTWFRPVDETVTLPPSRKADKQKRKAEHERLFALSKDPVEWHRMTLAQAQTPQGTIPEGKMLELPATNQKAGAPQGKALSATKA